MFQVQKCYNENVLSQTKSDENDGLNYTQLSQVLTIWSVNGDVDGFYNI